MPGCCAIFVQLYRKDSTIKACKDLQCQRHQAIGRCLSLSGKSNDHIVSNKQSVEPRLKRGHPLCPMVVGGLVDIS